MIRILRKISSKASAFICCISLILITDGAVFYLLPLRLLYPVTFDNGETHLKAGAILFNDFSEDFTGINRETIRRIHHGISLLEDGRVEQLIVVGGKREKSKRKGAQLMADYLLAQGVQAEKILVEASSKDSMTNLEQVEQILSDYGANVLGLISSPYHLLRIRAMDIPLSFELRYFSYNPSECFPPLSRNEVWFSAHYNALAYFAHIVLSENLYGKLVLWIRNNTDW